MKGTERSNSNRCREKKTMSANRLICLPDDVICRILSLLPTRCSVRTSILSKEWRYLWAHVPSSGFTCNEYCTECCAETVAADSTIMNQSRNINIFHRGLGTSNNDEFESWIATLFARNVRNLVIVLNRQLFMLPQCLFTCETLVDLRIVDCVGIPMDGVVCLPALKKLQLVNVGYDSDKSLQHLISGCLVLEELIIEKLKLNYCYVSSPTLTRLVLDVDEAIGVKLNNPALGYLRLRVNTSKLITVWGDSLIEADIDLNAGNFAFSCYVTQLVEMLHNVKCLTLSTSRMELPDYSFSIMDAKFRNLTELNLRADWRFITYFLESANNLRVLTIHRMVDRNTPYWIEPKLVPECLISHLETIKLVDFGWSTEHEFEMVKYVWKNSKVLKRMEIHAQLHELGSNKKLEALKRIELFERGSHACQIFFV